jgi:transposase
MGVCPPYVTLMTADTPQCTYSLREVFNGVRWIAPAGASWRMMPNDLPPWEAVDQQTQRWVNAGVFKAIVHDVCMLLRLAAGRMAQPSATILARRPLQSISERGHRAGDDGAKQQRGRSAYGRRYTGPPAGVACDPCE